MRSWPQAVSTLLLCLVSQVAGQDLMTVPIGFRSGFTEGAVTTRPGTIAVNAGASLRRANGTTTYRLGELDLRVPLSSRLEGRVYANSWVWRQTPGGSTSGREDASLALAAMLVTHAGIRPVTTLIVRLDTPTGTLVTRERSWRTGARRALGWELPGRTVLHSNLGVSRETLAGAAYTREVASLWLARHIAGALGVYGEAYGITRERPAGPMTGYLHGGISYLVGPSLHLDLHGGMGSRSSGSLRWVGLGFRRRY